MKQIIAIIKPHMLNRVLKTLHECEHFPGVTISDCAGSGRGRGVGGRYVAAADTLFLEPHKRVEILCSDPSADLLVQLLRESAHTGHPGDGMIAVHDLDRVVRIHTGQEQDDAV